MSTVILNLNEKRVEWNESRVFVFARYTFVSNSYSIFHFSTFTSTSDADDKSSDNQFQCCLDVQDRNDIKTVDDRCGG